MVEEARKDEQQKEAQGESAAGPIGTGQEDPSVTQ
jgi:hypothetical protein